MSLLWQQCINDLSTQLDEPILVQWIRPLQLIEKKDCLKLLAPNRFIWARRAGKLPLFYPSRPLPH